MFNDVFSEVSNGTFVRCFLHGVPPIFFKVVGVGCAWSSGVAAFLWSSSRPYLASASACSLPLIFAWAFILWSVVICVWDINILVIASRMFLYGWLLCNVGCLIWVFKRYRTLRQYVNIWVGSSRYVVTRSCRVWCIATISARSM